MFDAPMVYLHNLLYTTLYYTLNELVLFINLLTHKKFKNLLFGPKISIYLVLVCEKTRVFELLHTLCFVRDRIDF